MKQLFYQYILHYESLMEQVLEKVDERTASSEYALGRNDAIIDMPSYLSEFELVISDAQVIVGDIPLETIQARERMMESVWMEREDRETRAYEYRMHLLQRHEERRRERMRMDAKRRYKKEMKSQANIVRQFQMLHRMLENAFRHAQHRMEWKLGRQKAYVHQQFGNLQSSWLDSYRREFRVEYSRIPIAMEIRARVIKGVGETLPKGMYVVVARLYDRLGGEPLEWSLIAGRKHTFDNERELPHFTKAIYHRKTIDLRIHQRVFLHYPAECDVTPLHVIVFELVSLSSTQHPSFLVKEEVVGWGAIPISCGPCEILTGKFKIPLLRGPVDRTVKTFEGMERLCTRDLSCWLGNFYFELEMMTRGNDRLNVRCMRERLDPRAFRNEWTFGSDFDAKVDFVSVSTSTKDDTHAGTKPWTTFQLLNRSKKQSCAKIHVATNDQILHQRDPAIEKCHDSSSEGVQFTEKDLGLFPHFDEKLHSFAIDRLNRLSSHPKRSIFAWKLYFFGHELISDFYWKRIFSNKFWHFLTIFLLLLWMRMYVHYLGQWALLRSLHVPVYNIQVQRVTCFVKYTPANISLSLEIGVILIGCLSNFLVFLLASGLTLVFQTLLYELPVFGSGFVVALGISAFLDPFLIFLIDVLTHQYQCKSTFWVQTACVRIALSSQDCLCVEGDAFKLYSRFYEAQGSGIIGVFLTWMLYLTYLSMVLSSLYFHLLYIHMNGRVLDTYRRLFARESELFMPQDHEISVEALRGAIVKSEGMCLVKEDEGKLTHVAIFRKKRKRVKLVKYYVRTLSGAILDCSEDIHQFGEEMRMRFGGVNVVRTQWSCEADEAFSAKANQIGSEHVKEE
uniref:Uncharacterized protein AlNc14C24G2408 n=1 Tax=Albugo laibachii Nc14 TaxID=890382 RepID=F0W6A8_9STRA|nr:PREDICTED: hypothetical protein [Albugo laibachii Nc14]|eukprot:CCA16651.1 PREDICTED: hypothetical protein [Albugo laibachii Nc14]